MYDCTLLPHHWSSEKITQNLHAELKIQTKVVSGNNGRNSKIYISSSSTDARLNGIFVNNCTGANKVLAILTGKFVGFDRKRERSDRCFCVQERGKYNWFELSDREFFHHVKQPLDTVTPNTSDFVYTPTKCADLAVGPNCYMRYRNLTEVEVVALRPLMPREELFLSRVLDRYSKKYNGLVKLTEERYKKKIYPSLEYIKELSCTPEGKVCYFLSAHNLLVTESAFAVFVDTALTNINRVTVHIDLQKFCKSRNTVFKHIPPALIHHPLDKTVTLDCLVFEKTANETLIVKSVLVNENGYTVVHKSKMHLGELLCVDCNIPRTVGFFREAWENRRVVG